MEFPEGLGLVVGILALGYLLILAELLLPGGVTGLIGLGAVLYGCYLAFEMGTFWGAGAIVLSVVVTVVGINLFFRSRAGKRLVLNDQRPKEWKSQEENLSLLLDCQCVATTSLRPAGIAEFDGRRVDVVSDSEFLDAGHPVRVIEIEGNRVVVEAVAAEVTIES